MIFIMRWQGQSLITPVSPRGIIDLEFARTAERLAQLQLFLPAGSVYLNILLDFFFIAAYTWFFIAGCKYVKQKIKLGMWSDRFMSLAVAAACFDVCENFLMLLTFKGKFSLAVLEIVFYCAAIKFILAALIVLYLLITLPIALLYKKRTIIS